MGTIQTTESESDRRLSCPQQKLTLMTTILTTESESDCSN